MNDIEIDMYVFMNWSVLCSEVVFWLLLLCICGFSDGPNLNMFELGFLFEVWSSVLEELNSMFIVHRRFEVGFWQGFNQIFGRTFAILLKFLIRKVWIRFFIWGSPGSKFNPLFGRTFTNIVQCLDIFGRFGMSS